VSVSSTPRRSGCAEFLQLALPHLGYVWPGFRRVHRQVCKRIGRRLRELHLGDFAAYRQYLDSNPGEWSVLDGFCYIPISRFARDWPMFACLGHEVLPRLADAAAARRATRIAVWSVGCARGEEPYSVNAVWQFMAAPSRPGVTLDILATDISADLLDRAREGIFKLGSLRELPSGWWDQMFERIGTERRVKPAFRDNVRFELQDIRGAQPAGPFDLILCRNLVLTYFDAESQCRVLPRLVGALRPGGAFVIGARERLPEGAFGLVPWRPEHGIYARAADEMAAANQARANE
jgi:chemotaxis protein methyltransferase CheR